MPRKGIDLQLVVLGTLGALAAILMASGPLRLVMGLALCLFLSGYGVLAALYPGREDLAWDERLALSVGTSVLLVILVSLGLSYSRWGDNPNVVAIALSVVAVLGAAAAWLQRSSPPADQSVVPRIAVITERGKMRSVIAMSVAGVIVLSVGVYALHKPAAPETFTGFYVLGPDGTTSSYPTYLRPGSAVRLMVGVRNHEGRSMAYRLEASMAGRVVARYNTGAVPYRGLWRHSFSFTSVGKGRERLRLRLSRTDQPHRVYRSLSLQVTVYPSKR